MSLTARVLIGLLLGIALGTGFAVSGAPWTTTAVAIIEPLGTLFINAIRMTVVPLVVASLIAGVISAPDPRAVGSVGSRALGLFLVILVAGAAFSTLIGPTLLSRLPVDATAAAALRESAASASSATAERAADVPTLAQWLVSLVPANAIKAAADGAMLPLIIFSLAFGLAATRLPQDRRDALLRVVEPLAGATLALVRWILELAPIGVFALAVPLAARLGLAAAGALIYYVLATALALTLFMALFLYPAAVLFGGVSLRDFARACLPAQAVAFSARSSLAALPALIETSRDQLRHPPVITSFYLPLAATTFRSGSSVMITLGVLFIARLYGVDLSMTQLATIALTTVLTTFSVPGVPAGTIVVMLPVLLAAGLPPEGIGILMGIDTIPDMFRTVCNVTGHMAVATILARRGRDAALPAD